MCNCIQCIGDQPEPTQDEIDAARYRWLRKNREVLLLTGFFGNGCVNRTVWEIDAEIDAAIDAEMSAK